MNSEVTNRQIWEALKSFKDEITSFKDETNRRFDRIERLQESDHKMLIDIWDQRNSMQIKFSKGYLVFNSFIAGITAFMISTIFAIAAQ